MKVATKILRRTVRGAALAAILATAASAEEPSWPTPPAPAPEAESGAPPQAESAAGPESKPPSQLSPARLAQMLAPIALYPDDLLGDIFMAATYPLDVVEAARWLKDPENAALRGDQLFQALQEKSWDPSVKALAPFPRLLGMLDANIEWTEQLGEAYLADPAAVMDAVQRLRRQAQSAGRLVTTPQEVVRTEQAPARVEEFITIEAPSPEVVYVPVCDPSFAYGPWPYPGFPPFFPVFAGAAIGGCGWIGGPLIAPFPVFAVLNFRKRHIDIDHRRLALFDRDRDRDRGHAPVEEWRHDPGHRGNVPYRNPAVSARFGSEIPAANFNPAFRGRWTGPSRPGAEGALAAPPPQTGGRPLMEGARPPFDGGRPWPAGTPLHAGRPSAAGAPRFLGTAPPALRGVDPTGQSAGAEPPLRGARPSLEGVDPIGGAAPVGPSPGRDAETRMLIGRGMPARVPPTALTPPQIGLRASPPLGGMAPIRSLGDGRFVRPRIGVAPQSFAPAGPAPSGLNRSPAGGR